MLVPMYVPEGARNTPANTLTSTFVDTTDQDIATTLALANTCVVALMTDIDLGLEDTGMLYPYLNIDQEIH
jgi:hypothetical protein